MQSNGVMAGDAKPLKQTCGQDVSQSNSCGDGAASCAGHWRNKVNLSGDKYSDKSREWIRHGGSRGLDGSNP